jgi:mono/diheme cytochrome c family protein
MRLSLLLILAWPMMGAVQAADFTQDVKPLLDRHCVSCHGPDKPRASLRLDSARGVLVGGSSGPAVQPGKPEESLLLHALAGEKGARKMPPKGSGPSAAEVALIRRWVAEGAKPPAGEAVTPARRTSSHWAFQPVRASQPPRPEGKWASEEWRTLNPIDTFLNARMAKEGVTPSGEAPRETLLRRLALDMTGIPPTPEEVEAFLADRHPGAYERVVDRLLASPHFGERWGRHWLDQARYADSNGYSIDSPRQMWRYRDWVIAAVNAGMGFDQFTIEQLAGDLLPGADLQQKVATGFHRNTMVNEEGGIDPEQFRVEAIVDRTNTTGTVWLGLTLGCAQCHDHKFDPISQKEYYRLYAFFNQSDDPKLELISLDLQRKRKQHLESLRALESRLLAIDHLTPASLEKWEGSLTAEARRELPKPLQMVLALPPNGRSPRQQEVLWDGYRRADKLRHASGALAGPWAVLAQGHLALQREALEKEIVRTKKATPPSETALVLNERRTPRMTHVQLGGDFLRRGAVVEPGVPEVLPELKAVKPTRLDLSRWLVSGESPLTARVAVNRVWQQYFGLGLVETDNDFGTQGSRPSHPELLDWLAGEYVRLGWSPKALHRLIVTSAAYRRSSKARPDLAVQDPRNLLLARQSRLRLEAEAIRDAALAASGLLTRTLGGPSVFPPQPGGVYSLTQVPKNWVASTGPDRFRRGMYTFFWRSAPHPGLTVFDAPDATATCTRRNRSNTPMQALTLLNDEAFVECARALGEQARQREGSDEARLAWAFTRVVGRAPTSREAAVLLRFLGRQREGGSESQAWAQVGRVVLNLDEAMTRE